MGRSGVDTGEYQEREGVRRRRRSEFHSVSFTTRRTRKRLGIKVSLWGQSVRGFSPGEDFC